MDTRIVLPGETPVDEGSRMSNFLYRYGSSISSLHIAWVFTDHLAAELDDVTQIHGSRLTHPVLTPSGLTPNGLLAVDRIIKRSQRLVYLWLYFVNLEETFLAEQVVPLLGRFGEKLNRLALLGDSIQRWLPRLAQAFPSRTSFPALTLLPHDWETLIKALDFSVLKTLVPHGTNFSWEQLDLLIECIAGNDANLVPLEDLNLTDTDLLLDASKDVLRARIQKVAPRVTIQGL